MWFVSTFVICNVILVHCHTQAWSHEEVISRILYGTPASIKEFPYFASLGNCGAAIISKRWLLTAAHCITRDRPRTATVGGENDGNSIRVRIDKIFKHQHFGQPAPSLNNDIALLRLHQPLTFTDKVKPVKLPQADNISRVHKFVGKGTDETGRQTYSIMKVDLLRLTPKECLDRLSTDFRNQVSKFVEKTIICITRREQMPGVCSGDSGGPMVANNTLIGLTSFMLHIQPNGKPDCGRAPVAFYTKVVTYMPWIKSIVGNDLDL